jgi:hypothetical protein
MSDAMKKFLDDLSERLHAMGADHQRLVGQAVASIAADESGDLARCTAPSIVLAVMEAAALGVDLGSQAVLVAHFDGATNTYEAQLENPKCRLIRK